MKEFNNTPNTIYGIGNQKNQSQFTNDLSTDNSYLQNDYTAWNLGNNSTDSWWNNNSDYNNMKNVDSLADNSEYNSYQLNNSLQNNYASNNYQHNNYVDNDGTQKMNYRSDVNPEQNSYINNHYSDLNNTSERSKVIYQRGEFKIEFVKPEKHRSKPVKYREPDDPQSAEIIFLKNSKWSKISNIYYTVNILLIIVSLIFVVNDINSTVAIVAKYLFFVSFFAIFIVTLIKELISIHLTPKIKKARCTYPVTAKIIDVKIRSDSQYHHRYYYPIYKFCYKGNIYILTSNSSWERSRAMIGEKVELFINENDLADYFYPSEYNLMSTVISTIFCLIFLVMVIFVMFIFLFSYGGNQTVLTWG